VLRYRMPIDQVLKLISGLQLDETINTWKAGVERALKKYAEGMEIEGTSCPQCRNHSIVASGGCYQCSSCGWSKCG